MTSLLQHLSFFFKSSKPHHVITGFLFLILIGVNGHLYAEQRKVVTDQTLKADKETISDMLSQTKDLIAIQRESQVLQGQQWQESVRRTADLESRTLQNHTKVQEELLMLKSTQLDIVDLVRLQQRNSEALLKKLEALDKKVEALSIKVD